MKFTISVQHDRTLLHFLIKQETDGIFIALPEEKDGWGESIFLTKSGAVWVGDSSNKKLVEKIGREIDAACRLKAADKRNRPEFTLCSSSLHNKETIIC